MNHATMTVPLLLLLALAGGCDNGAATTSELAPAKAAATTKADPHGHDHHDGAGEGDDHVAERQYPFEWGGIYLLPAGQVQVVLQPGPDDPSMNVALLPTEAPTLDALESLVEQVEQVFSQTATVINSGEAFATGPQLHQLKLQRQAMHFMLNVEKAGSYALFTEHFPTEFKMAFLSGTDVIKPLAIHEFRIAQVTLTPQAIRANAIRVAPAKALILTGSIVAPARVAYDADKVAHVSSLVSGRVSEIKARVGDNVKRGDVLLVVESTELGEAQSDFLQKRTAVETAGPSVELAKSAYNRATQLYEKQGISLTELQKRQGEWQAAQGGLATAKAAMTAAENRLHLLGMKQQDVETLAKSTEINPAFTISAPIDGRVTEREVTLGELITPEKERLIVLADLSEVWVLADVPEAKIGQITVGSKTSVTVPALGGGVLESAVSYIAAELDPATRTARVRIEVANPQVRLLPGMFARVEIASGSIDDTPVIAVPDAAVQTIEGEPALFVPVEGEPNTFAKRAVTIGQTINGMVPVHTGLKEGEQYVADGSFILKAELGKGGAAHEH